MSKAENPNQGKLLLLSGTPDFEAYFAENEIHFPNLTEIELLDKKRKINLQKLFTPEGMDLIIAGIQKEVVDFSADISTKKGRAEIISMAAKVAKCKSPIKNLASELKEESRRLIDGVNAQLKRYETEMDTLRDEIRKPVDEIEEKEAAELKARQDRLAAMENLRSATNGLILPSSEFLKLIEEVKIYSQFDWGDFTFKAQTLAKDLIVFFEQRRVAAKKAEDDATELAQLKKEKEEREKKDREEQIAKEAAEKAKREAEEAVERERKAEESRRLRVEEEKRVAEEQIFIFKRKQDLNRLHLIQDQITGSFILEGSNASLDGSEIVVNPSQFLAKTSEDEWFKFLEELSPKIVEAYEKRKIASEKKAKEDAEKAALEAVEKERLRVAEEKCKEDEAAEKLAADKGHRAKINDQAASDLIMAFNYRTTIELGLSDALAILEEIAEGKIKNVQINY